MTWPSNSPRRPERPDFCQSGAFFYSIAFATRGRGGTHYSNIGFASASTERRVNEWLKGVCFLNLLLPQVRGIFTHSQFATWPGGWPRSRTGARRDSVSGFDLVGLRPRDGGLASGAEWPFPELGNGTEKARHSQAKRLLEPPQQASVCQSKMSFRRLKLT